MKTTDVFITVEEIDRHYDLELITEQERVEALARLAVFPSSSSYDAARVRLSELRLEELATYDPSAFEGTPEDGPSVPQTQVERTRSAVECEIKRDLTDRVLRTCTSWGLDWLDAAFSTAAAVDSALAPPGKSAISPLYVLRRGQELEELGLEGLSMREAEGLVTARMRAEETN